MPRKLVSITSAIVIIATIFYVGYYHNTLTFDPIRYHAVLHIIDFEKKSPEKQKELAHIMHLCFDEIAKKAQDYGYSKPSKKSGVYPTRADDIFITHAHDDYGWYTIHLPKKLSFETFVTLADPICKAKNLPVCFSSEKRVEIAQPLRNLEGVHFTEAELEQARKGERGHYDQYQPYIDWQWKNPFVGLFEQNDDVQLVPHWAQPVSWNFSLWDLAPKKGEGLKVAVIDTGASGFNVQYHQDTYKKNKNITLHQNLLEYGYNLVSDHGLDPVMQVALALKPLIDPAQFNLQEILEKIPGWILEYRNYGSTSQFENYAAHVFKNEFKKKSGVLNKKGRSAFKKFITEQFSSSLFATTGKIFDVVTLLSENNKKVLLETLPIPAISEQPQTVIAGHGSCTYGLIAGDAQQGGVTGLAPQASVYAIKAFKDDGTTTKSTLVSALKHAKMLGCDVVNLSLKIADHMDLNSQGSQDLKTMIESFPYVVAASGNDGNPGHSGYAGKIEAYPAQFGAVAFDVGAFLWDADNNDYKVCDFSQYQPKVGPKILAPGFNVLGPGLIPNQIDDSIYLFMDGTSIAAPIITGFVSLAVNEFKDVLTREHILKTLYYATMSYDETWQEKSLLGMLDMRTGLLALHCLSGIKNELAPDVFEKDFDALLRAVHECILYPTRLTSTQFEKNYKQFAREIQTKKEKQKKLPIFGADLKTIQSTITQIVLDAHAKNKPEKGRFSEVYSSLIELIHQKNYRLFVANTNERIKLVIQK